MPGTPERSAPPDTVAHRIRQRIFHPWTRAGDVAPPHPPAVKPQRKPRRELGFQARIAEFLLIHRLRARRSGAPSADVLLRAEQIVFVTCQNWFEPVEHCKPRSHRQL